MSYTLAQQLEPLAISFEVLDKKYRPMLSLVNELIGVIPNADTILEIWPIGFRTYNLLVPNLLDLPNSLWKGGALKQLIGLAMYTASRTAECNYCAAHCCSFALRRGLDPRVISGEQEYTEIERAVIGLAEGMSKTPANLSKNHLTLLTAYMSEQEIEKIVLAVSLMGFLNKFMDALGIELEIEAIQDVGELLSFTGWNPGKHSKEKINFDTITSKQIKKDNFWTYLRILKYAPRAILMEKKWTKGMPNNYITARKYLEEHTGHEFPVLSKVKSKRVIKALTAILKDNLNLETSHSGLRIKHLASLVYHIVIDDKGLIKESELILSKLAPDIDVTTINRIKRIAKNESAADVSSCKKRLLDLFNNTCLNKEESAAILFVRAISNSPAEVNKAVLLEVVPHMKPQSSVELGVWISVQQLLHRLNSYFEVVEN